MFQNFFKRCLSLAVVCLALTAGRLVAVEATNGVTNPSAPIQPSWDQLLNGSLESKYIEVRGMIGDVHLQKDGWSMVTLRTRQGDLRIVMLPNGSKGSRLDGYVQAVVRVRGHVQVDREPANLRILPGQFRMGDAEVIVDQPPPADPFDAPLRTAASLTRSDPDYDPFRWVKVPGQILIIRGRVGFMMNGKDGIRFVADRMPPLDVGDMVEVVGYPGVLSAAAPVLYGAAIRKTGHAALPLPRSLTADELVLPKFDSTLVRLEGTLMEIKPVAKEWILEIKTGNWRYWARLARTKEPLSQLRVGSRVELTGTYCAQGEYKILGPDVACVDLLLNTPADLKVLASPPWWTAGRLRTLVEVLLCLLLVIVIWVTQLQRLVRQRSVELMAVSRQRQRIEHEHALEQERARIAQDLHDELGGGITAMGMLATRASSPATTPEKRAEYLEEMSARAREMVAALDEIVWAMNPEHNSLGSLVSYCSLYADRFLSLANITWQLADTTVQQGVAMDSQRRHQLFLAFKEALNNVVRHSGATEVRIAVVMEAGSLRLSVADNGHGLPARESVSDSDGLPNMQKRLEKLGGRFEINSPSGGGTTVQFILPLK